MRLPEVMRWAGGYGRLWQAVAGWTRGGGGSGGRQLWGDACVGVAEACLLHLYVCMRACAVRGFGRLDAFVRPQCLLSKSADFAGHYFDERPRSPFVFDKDVGRLSSRFCWAASTGCRCVGTANLHVARCAWPLSWVSWRPAAHDALAGLSLWHVADAQPIPMATRSDARAAVLCSSAGPDELANGDGRLRRQPCKDELGRWSPGGRGPSREAAAVSFTKQVGPGAGTAQFCRKDGGGTAAASFSTMRI